MNGGRSIKLTAVILTFLGVGIIAYTGLAGASAIQADQARLNIDGSVGYCAGAVAVAAGVALLLIAERRS